MRPSPEVRRLQAAGQAVRAAQEARWPHDPIHDAKVARRVADGWRIVKVTRRGTVLVAPDGPLTVGELLPWHLLLMVCTLGMWAPVLIAHLIKDWAGRPFGTRRVRRRPAVVTP